jgi:hypothetical protein
VYVEEEASLKRPLSEGESVILSTGATAIVRRSYPAGYSGDVEIMLDGQAELERAGRLTLSEPDLPDPGPDLGDATVAQDEMGETRAPSRRMENQDPR